MTAKEALKGISEELKKLTPVPFEDTQYYQVLKDVIEELEAIKTADYNDTIKMLKGMHLITLDPLEATNEEEREALLYAKKKADKTNAKLDIAINALLKSQQQAKELAELKKSIGLLKEYYECTDWIEFERLLDKLCKGSERE